MAARLRPVVKVGRRVSGLPQAGRAVVVSVFHRLLRRGSPREEGPGPVKRLVSLELHPQAPLRGASSPGGEGPSL